MFLKRKIKTTLDLSSIFIVFMNKLVILLYNFFFKDCSITLNSHANCFCRDKQNHHFIVLIHSTNNSRARIDLLQEFINYFQFLLICKKGFFEFFFHFYIYCLLQLENIFVRSIILKLDP